MAEVGGLLLGVTSLLAGFKGAVDGCKLLSDIYHGFDGASFYAAKLEIENQRLQVWGKYFGFNDVDECEKLRAQPEIAQSLVLYILNEFQDATTNLEKMSGKYGVKLVDTNIKITPDAHTKLQPGSVLLDSLAERQQKTTAKLKWWKKCMSWVLEVPKFEKLLDRLEYLNDSLERVVPRVDLQLLTQGIASYLVPGQSQSYLPTFQQSSQQYLAMCAAAGEIKLTTNLLSQVPEVGWKEILWPSTEEIFSDGSSRVLAAYRSQKNPAVIQEIIIDWKEPDLALDATQRQEALTRIKGMCLLFTKVSANYFTDFRVLPCLGLVDDPRYAKQHPGYHKYGFVFRHPSPQSGRLEALCKSYKSLTNVSISDRFRLAQNLASGLLLLHSSKWLHKNIRSENVLMFRPNNQDPHARDHITQPYLMGFSYSRPDGPDQVSLERPRTNRPLDYYRHPDFQKGHSRYNDIYSLGVVLFEIGHWQSMETIASKLGQENQFPSEVEVRLTLEANCGPGRGLRARMGTVYASVVRRCIAGDFGVPSTSTDGGELVRAFWSQVVRELDSCRA